MILASSHHVMLDAGPCYRRIRMPYVAPGTAHEACWTPRARPVRLLSVCAGAHPDDPEIGYFLRAHRAGGSGRRGRAASQHWAGTRLAVLRDPGRFPPRARLRVEVGRRTTVDWASIARPPDFSPVEVEVDEDIRVRVVSEDFRVMVLSLSIVCEE